MVGYRIRVKRVRRSPLKWRVTIEEPSRHRYAVDVEIEIPTDKAPRVRAVNVRAPGSGTVSGRDVRRLKLDSYIKAALAAIPTGPTISWADSDYWTRMRTQTREALRPKGGPQRGKSTAWYLRLLEDARAFERTGESPARKIAEREDVEVNTVYQWFHRAKQLDKQRGRRSR